MEMMGKTILRLDRKRPEVLAELHPDLLPRVLAILRLSGGKLTPWCGYRSEKEQNEAKARGFSNAAWGQSPHNYRPALACDLVLDPRFVRVRPNKSDPRYPDLWDDASPEALDVWARLEDWAADNGLMRVTVGGRPDLPHVELPRWRSYISQAAAGKE